MDVSGWIGPEIVYEVAIHSGGFDFARAGNVNERYGCA
jgi:hypothetical protein